MAVAEQSISLKTRRKTEFKHNHSWLTDLFCGFAASLRGSRDGIVFFKEFEKFDYQFGNEEGTPGYIHVFERTTRKIVADYV